jgi:hypothetical protein
VVPDEGPLVVPAFLPSPVTVRPPSAIQPGPTWSVAQEEMTGRTTLTLGHLVAVRTPEGTQIERRFGGTFEVDRADPANVVAKGWHACRSTTGADVTEARADVTIASTAGTFDVTIDLVVTVDGEVHATRRWDESIPRRLL